MVKFWPALVTFAAFAGAAPQTVPGPDPTAALFGWVVNALTHQPVRRAAVKIYNSKDQWDQLTDGEGRFKFPPLKRAEYGFAAHRDGFTERTYKVELSDFDDPKELAIELFPQGVIAGKVVDGLGQPLQRAQIEALRARSGAANPEVVGSESTNDLGEYRLSGLDPGVYRIRATYRDGRESELDPTPITTASATKPAELTVKPGTVISGIDFVLSSVRPVSVRGAIHTETGQPVDRVSMSIAGPRRLLRRLPEMSDDGWPSLSNRQRADYESQGPLSMPCDGVISWLLERPMPSTRDTPGNEKHSCWLSPWLSTSLNRGIRSSRGRRRKARGGATSPR
jgi:hypothetical protein